MDSHQVIRILDASLNRAAEGLRVVEDFVRFVLDDGHLTEEFKRLRHDLAAAGAVLSLSERHAARDTRHDVGTEVTTPSERRREDAWGVCVASTSRVKQSLRSLEEYSKVAKPQAAAAFEALRYRLYTLEAALGRTADAVQQLESVRLYVLIDGCDSEAAFVGLVEQLAAAGVDAIQLREKRLGDRGLIERGRLLRNILNTHAACGSLPLAGRAGEGVRSRYTPQSPLPSPPPQGEGTGETLQGESEPSSSIPLCIINDRADVAAIVDADGVHLGQDDMTVKDARAVVGPRKLIGVSTHSIEQARGAVLDGANYIGVGPTFPSRTKEFAAFSGLELVRQVAAEIRLPAFAIGGITTANVGEVISAGLDRVAVSSAIVHAAKPQAAGAELRAILYGESI